MNQFIKEIQEQPEMLERTLAIIIQEKERSVWMLSVLCGQPVTMTK